MLLNCISHVSCPKPGGNEMESKGIPKISLKGICRKPRGGEDLHHFVFRATQTLAAQGDQREMPPRRQLMQMSASVKLQHH